MKTATLTLISGLGLSTLALSATAQEARVSPDSAAKPPVEAGVENGLRFNFRNAPLEQVLNYMSEAAGFVIVLDNLPSLRGTVDMWSAHPVTKDEALQLLNHQLNRQGYTATIQGRNLIIAAKEDAKKRNIPIRTGNDHREIPANAEMIMQVVPLRHINAAQVAADLQTLIPTSATVTANADSNSLVIIDTQINVRHIVELISSLDLSVESVSTMRVFQLKNSDPVEMAQLINNLYAQPASSGNSAMGPMAAIMSRMGGMFGGRSGGFPGMPGSSQGSRGSSSRSSTSSMGGGRSPTRESVVTAVPDPRTFSVIVTASKETMPGIAEIIAQLDENSARKQKVFVYTLENANPRQVETALRNLFPNSSGRNTQTSGQTDLLTNRASNPNQVSNALGGGVSRTR